jgi:hypothetical protein
MKNGKELYYPKGGEGQRPRSGLNLGAASRLLGV